MRRTMIMSLVCLAAAACSRTEPNRANGDTSATTSNTVPGSNALNDNPSGATPINNDRSGAAPMQPRSDGVELAGGGHEAGVAIGGGPATPGELSAYRKDGGAQLGASATGSGDKGWTGSSAAKGAKHGDDGASCPGDNDVRVTGKNGSAGFCARACRSDIDCSPNGKCAGTGETSANGYSQPNGKYCTGM